MMEQAVDVMMTSKVGDETMQQTKRHDSHLEVDTLW